MASIAQGRPSSRSTPPLQGVPIKSSFIASVQYDEANETLTTYLIKGYIYQHKDFSQGEWEALKTSQNHSKAWSGLTKGKPSVRIKSAKAPRAEIKRRTK